VQLLVLGMHRSGTSVAARILNLLGCHFAPELLVVDANDENPRGFWERHDVLALHESVLQAAGVTWRSPLGFDPWALPDDVVARFTDGAGRILRDLDAHRPWFIKDPRLCLTLPLWRPLLEAPLAVHVLRHPLEVAASLQARNALPVPVGLAIWEMHVRQALAWSADWPRIVVHHRRLLTDTVPTVLRLLRQLQAAGVSGLRMPAERELTAFVTPDLHRQRSDSDDLRPWADAPQVRLFHRLEADIAALDGEPSAFTWETVRTLFAAHEAERMVAGVAETQQLREERMTLAGLCREREQRVFQLERETSNLEHRLAAAEREADGLRRDLAARTLRLATQAAAAKAAHAELQDLQGGLTSRLARKLRRLWSTCGWMPVGGACPIDGDRELVASSDLFDRDWYLATYADIAAAGIDPLDHYLLRGGFEGRDPGPAFDSAAYLLAHADAAEAGINPLVHHLRHGGGRDRPATARRAA